MMHAMTVAAALGAMLWAGHASAAAWQVDHGQSSITFTVTQMGSPVEGSFGDFTADIEFDPAAPETATVRAEIALDSVDTGNGQRDGALKGSEFLDVASHPTGVFESTGFEANGGTDYDVAGSLTLRGISQDVVLPVTIAIEGDTATVAGALEINRRDFEIAVNNADANKAIGEIVTISLQLVAAAAGQ